MMDQYTGQYASEAPFAPAEKNTQIAQWTERLAHVDQRTATEQQAADLAWSIEKLGVHPLLTTAQSHVHNAMCLLGEWHDHGSPGGSPLTEKTLDSVKVSSDEKVIDVQSEHYREYVYKDGSVYRITSPKTVVITRTGSHRVLDADGLTHRPELGYLAIRWCPKADTPAFVA